MCSMKTEAMNSRLITNTGTGPLSGENVTLINILDTFSSAAATHFIDELLHPGGAGRRTEGGSGRGMYC